MGAGTAGKVARPERPTMGRRLVLVDVENVVGGLVVSEEIARYARASIDGAVGCVAGDHVVVATCHKGYPHVAWCWPSARRLVRSGPDGADLELLGVLRENISQRFSHVVVVSGDGIFTEAVAELGRAGVRVTVVARRGHLSNRLRLAAWRVVLLDQSHAPWMGSVA